MKMKRTILVSLAVIMFLGAMSIHTGRRQAVSAAETNNIVWVVEPTLEYDSIFLCSCGLFVIGDWGNWQIISPETGQIIGPYLDGHGWDLTLQVFDPILNLFGDPGYGGEMIYLLWMHPLNEVLQRYPHYANFLTAIESVDSSMRDYHTAWDGIWDLSPQAYSGSFAAMYNGQFITDFIFDGFNRGFRADVIPVSLNGRWGLIDRHANETTPFVFDNLWVIDNATAFARYNGRYGILDVVLTTVSENPNPTQTTYPIYITTANLNLRQSPSTDAASHGIVPRWTQVYMLEVINEEWYRVRTQPNTRTVEDENIGNIQGYMASEFLQAVYAPANISSFGRQVAEEFLSQFFTIFTDRSIPVAGWWGMEEGQFISGYEIDGHWHEVITYETPDIYFRHDLESWENSGFFDRYGNRITNQPWMLWDLYATGFSLYNFDNNGIPDIMIYYWGNYFGSGDGGTPASLFRFIDGAYRRISYVSPWWDEGPRYNMAGEFRFYYDALGNFIKHLPPFVDLSGFYYYATFNNTLMDLEIIASLDNYWDGSNNHTFWTNHITGETNISIADFPLFSAWGDVPPLTSRFIPGTTMSITRIQPLTSLQNEITATLTQRLADGEPDEDETQRPPAPNLYIYTPVSIHETFAPNPAVLAQVNNLITAIEQIENTIDSLTIQQRTSGDAINTVTLQIENIVRRGSTQEMPQNGNFNAAILQNSADISMGVYSYTESILRRENISLLRRLRANLNFEADDANEIMASFPDSVSGITFDNVTIESEFAAVTLNRNHILPGGVITIRRLEPGEENISPVSAITEADSNPETNEDDYISNEYTAPSRNIFTGLWNEIRDFSNPITILSNFWFVIVIIVLLIIWLIVAGMGERLRKWVVPVFAILALVINMGLVMLRINTTDTSYPPGTYTADNDYASALTPTPYYTDTVEVTMTDGMRATLSLPVNGNNPEFLVLVNEDGEIQHSRYNPVTGNIDARIRESGTYTLLENQISFVDIDDKSQLMQHAILQLTSRGIMQGIAEAGYFFPDAPISRTELVSTIIMAFDMLNLEAESSFTDVNRQAWYYLAVATAQEAGLVTGFEGGTFRGAENIPKEQLVVMAARSLMEQMGYYVPDNIETFLERFLDRDVLRSWSLDGIALATSSNVLIHRADGMFAPRSAMTRGDAAIVLYRVFSRVW